VAAPTDLTDAAWAASPARAVARRFGGAARSLGLAVAVAVAVLALWEWTVVHFAVSEIILPAPSRVALVFADRLPLLTEHSIPSGIQAFCGFAIACALGIVLAVAVTFSETLKEAVYPYLIAFQVIPKVALAPLFTVALGIGFVSRLAFVVFITFFPIVVALATGLTNTNPDVVRMCRGLTATRAQIFRHVRFPFALHHLFAGMKIGATMAIIGIVVAEFITSEKGLGFVILNAASRLDTALVLAAIVALCVIGFALYGLVVVAEVAARRWYGG
jgi:NitT/TauT family transport system permease protein